VNTGIIITLKQNKTKQTTTTTTTTTKQQQQQWRLTHLILGTHPVQSQNPARTLVT